jgi:hypothetical protein
MTFRESVMLLILTAVLTGLLVPAVKEFIDRRSLRKQQFLDEMRRQEEKKYDAEKRQEEKKFDAALARQSSMLESEAGLLDNLAAMLWRLWKMVLKVVYYRTLHNLPDRHEVAFREYDEHSWDLMCNIRAEISRARRLASPDIHDRLAKLFDSFVDDVDSRLNELRRLDNEQKWNGTTAALTKRPTITSRKATTTSPSAGPGLRAWPSWARLSAAVLPYSRVIPASKRKAPTELVNQVSKEELHRQWDAFRVYIYIDVGNKIDAVLTDLALQLRLAERPDKVD